MNLENKLISLKSRISLSLEDLSDEKLLTILLEEAENYILSYTRREKENWIDIFNNIQIKVAAIEYGRIGSEGLTSRTEGDLSENYGTQEDYPHSITKALNSYRLAKVIT